MLDKLVGARYINCSSKDKFYKNEDKFDGTFTINGENLVFKANAIYWLDEQTNVDLEIPLRNIERLEKINLNMVTAAISVFMKDGTEYVLGSPNSKDLQKLIIDAKNALENINQKTEEVFKKKKEKQKRPPIKINAKLLVISIISLILILIIFIAYLIVNNYEQKNILTQEIEKITSIQEIDMHIKTKGEYAKIEKVIKEYKYKMFELEKQYNENSTINLFNEMTPKYLDENKEKLGQKLNSLGQNEKLANEAAKNIIMMLDSDYIMEQISDYNLSDEYKEIYSELMLNTDNSKLIEQWQISLKHNTQQMAYVRESIQILIDNKDKWYIKNNVLYIEDNELLANYNRLYDKVYTEK